MTTFYVKVAVSNYEEALIRVEAEDEDEALSRAISLVDEDRVELEVIGGNTSAVIMEEKK